MLVILERPFKPSRFQPGSERRSVVGDRLQRLALLLGFREKLFALNVALRVLMVPSDHLEHAADKDKPIFVELGHVPLKDKHDLAELFDLLFLVVELRGHVGQIAMIEAMPFDQVVGELFDAGVERVTESEEALNVVPAGGGVTERGKPRRGPSIAAITRAETPAVM